MIFLDSFVQMPLLNLPVRTTVVQIEKACILISPGSKLTEEQLRSLPEPTDIIANNMLHSGGIAQAARLFPRARVWGVPGLKDAKPNLPWSDELNEKNWPYNKEIPIKLVEGMPKTNEVVFYHPESKTLIVSDLFFNLISVRGIGAWIILKLFGTYKKFGISRLYLKQVKDQPSFVASLKEILKFDIKKIVMAHGNLIEQQGSALIYQALKQRGLD